MGHASLAGRAPGRGRSAVSGAGYSGTRLARKLGIKDGDRVLLAGAPDGFRSVLEPLPSGVRIHSRASRDDYDAILLFALRGSTLDRRLPALTRRLAWTGGLWICWPKKASGVPTELSGGAVRATGLGAGLVDNKVCAVDETWSGLRFVYRVEDRPAS